MLFKKRVFDVNYMTRKIIKVTFMVDLKRHFLNSLTKL